MSLSRKTLTCLAAAALLTVTLSACGSDDDPASGTPSNGDDAVVEEPADDATDSESDGTTLPGTGTYTVGDDAPIGGYDLGEVVEQPDGCTWSLLGKNGEVIAEDTGALVFLTDVTITFKTDGCPDWIQFE